MRTKIVLLCLVGSICYIVQAVRVLENDQDNFQWISKIFRGNTSRQSDCDCECGKAKVQRNPLQTTRIVGGKEAIKHSHPWIAAFMYTGIIFCGGSVINDRYILGAAHCNEAPLKDLIIRLGAHDVEKDSQDDYKDYKVEEVIEHENYDSVNFYNDIAVYKLAEKIEMSDYVTPICFPDKDEDFVGTVTTVIGWGRIQHGGDPSPFLREVDVPIVSRETCRKNLGEDITEKMLCAGYDEGGKDSCEGDSGGPLFFHDSNTGRTRQLGIVSYGIKCADPKLFGVYTKVSSFKGWIKEKTSDACYCKDSS